MQTIYPLSLYRLLIAPVTAYRSASDTVLPIYGSVIFCNSASVNTSEGSVCIFVRVKESVEAASSGAFRLDSTCAFCFFRSSSNCRAVSSRSMYSRAWLSWVPASIGPDATAAQATEDPGRNVPGIRAVVASERPSSTGDVKRSVETVAITTRFFTEVPAMSFTFPY